MRVSSTPTTPSSLKTERSPSQSSCFESACPSAVTGFDEPLPTRGEERHQLRTDILAAGSFHQQLGNGRIMWREQGRSVLAIPIEDPASKQKSRPFVPFSERLRTG